MYYPAFNLLCAFSCESLLARTFGELLRFIVSEIAHKLMEVEKTFRTVATALQKAVGSDGVAGV